MIKVLRERLKDAESAVEYLKDEIKGVLADELVAEYGLKYGERIVGKDGREYLLASREDHIKHNFSKYESSFIGYECYANGKISNIALRLNERDEFKLKEY